MADARYVAGALVDYLGFVFYEKSDRHITPAEAGAMTNWIEGPQKVGVFVNQPLDDVNMIARQSGMDLVQLHGNESAEYCSLVEKPVIKAVHVEKTSTVNLLKEEIEKYKSPIDFLLFDTGSSSQWGGTGQSFDWQLLDELSHDIPFFLAGGINPENIQEACQTVQPYGVDLSSGLESEPGIKDFDKIERFMQQFKELNTSR